MKFCVIPQITESNKKYFDALGKFTAGNRYHIIDKCATEYRIRVYVIDDEGTPVCLDSADENRRGHFKFVPEIEPVPFPVKTKKLAADELAKS